MSRLSAWKCTFSSPPRRRSSAAVPPVSARLRTRMSAPCAWALPGALPVLNRLAVELAIKAGHRAALQHPPDVAICPQELFLPGSSQGLPDFAIRRAAGRARLGGYRSRRQAEAHRRDARAHGRRRRQEHARGLQGFRPLHLRGPEPQRHAADRDRQRAGYADVERSLCVSGRGQAGAAVHRSLHLRYGERAICAATPTFRCG